MYLSNDIFFFIVMAMFYLSFMFKLCPNSQISVKSHCGRVCTDLMPGIFPFYAETGEALHLTSPDIFIYTPGPVTLCMPSEDAAEPPPGPCWDPAGAVGTVLAAVVV